MAYVACICTGSMSRAPKISMQEFVGDFRYRKQRGFGGTLPAWILDEDSSYGEQEGGVLPELVWASFGHN